MSNNTPNQSEDSINLAAEIVSAYVSKNPIPAAELPALLRNTYAAIVGLSGAPTVQTTEPPASEKPTPAQIRKSITPDGLISFIDGKPYKTLKRHLSTHDLTPQTYRQRYDLPSDYPMVAPSYSAQRSALAKSIGLGQLGGMAKAADAREAKPRGRRKAS